MRAATLIAAARTRGKKQAVVSPTAVNGRFLSGQSEEARRIAEEARNEAARARDEGRKHAVQSSQRIAELGEQIKFFKGLIEDLQSARSPRTLATQSRHQVRKERRSRSAAERIHWPLATLQSSRVATIAIARTDQ